MLIPPQETPVLKAVGEAAIAAVIEVIEDDGSADIDHSDLANSIKESLYDDGVQQVEIRILKCTNAVSPNMRGKAISADHQVSTLGAPPTIYTEQLGTGQCFSALIVVDVMLATDIK
jgi:hypothetical protein